MALNSGERAIYRKDALSGHTRLTDAQREVLALKHLPGDNDITAWQVPRKDNFGVRQFIRKQAYVVLYAILHTLFSLYIRLRQAMHIVAYQISAILFYHHRTPSLIKRDVTGLPKKPKHLSSILHIESTSMADIEQLINEASNIAAWSSCAEIPTLSIYERTGVLKKSRHLLQRAILQKFSAYYGREHPGFVIGGPHAEPLKLQPTGAFANPDTKYNQLTVFLISEEDGRDSIVDLTRTLTEMSQQGRLSPLDINIELIDAELSEGIMGEPDLLLVFTPYVDLAGYPPWQIRLTEIYHQQDVKTVGYQVFINALRKYAGAQFRIGK